MDAGELNARIAEAATHLDDPREIAKYVGDDLSVHDLRDVLAIVFPGYVRLALHKDRRVPTQKAPLAVAGRSSKLAARSDWWAQILDAKYYDGEIWVPLRDMTKRQVLAVAALRRKQAEQNVAVAERFERLAAQMTRSRAATVGALNPERAKAAWQDAA